jgi:hypothetical protein
MDSKYVFKFASNYQSYYIFQGFSGLSDIKRSKNGNVWRLVTNNRTSELTNMVASLMLESKFPFGALNWTFTSHCEDGLKRQSLIELTRVHFSIISSRPKLKLFIL